MMDAITRIGLIGLLALSVPAFCQNDDRLTARSKLDSVVIAARVVASDAQLIFVFSPTPTDSTGKSEHWAYIFKSTGKESLFEFHYASGHLGQSPALTVSDPFVHIGLEPLPDNWIDSDAALAKANRAGGRAFIAANGEYTVQSGLYARGSPASSGSNSFYVASSWRITYEGPKGQMDRLINASTGGVRSAFPIDWYIEVLHATAESADPDAELVVVVGEQVAANGRSNTWLATYRSRHSSTLREYWLHEYRLMPQSELSFGDEEMLRSLPPLPASWISSDQALAVAEQKGGHAFRQAHPNWRCAAHLWTKEVIGRTDGREFPFPGFPLWEVVYDAPGATTLAVRVDASTGMPVDNLFDGLSPVTAGQGLAQVDSTVTVDSLDVTLVFVEAYGPAGTGKARIWNYVYWGPATSYSAYLYLGRPEQSVVRFSGFPGFGHVLSPLTSPWVDSDSAAAVAEREAGEAFRQVNPQVDMEMRIYTSAEYLPVERPAWKVAYASSNGAWTEVAVDGEYGLAYDSLPRIGPIEGLQDAVTTAQSEDPSVSLVRVAARVVNLDGKARRWHYQFAPAESETLVEWWNHGGIVYREPSPGAVDPNLAVLPAGWIDADSALAVAEMQGGAPFRAEHADWRINMELTAVSTSFQKTSSALGTRATWDVHYTAPDGADQHFPVEAAYDAVTSTAGVRFADVNALARSLAEDIELISVLAYGVDLAGRHETWFYIYQSHVLQKLFQIVVQDGVASLSDVVAVYDESVYLGAPALPPRWADSDLAVSMAEASGGSTFRVAHPGYTIRARLFTPLDARSRWEIRYELSDTWADYEIDALTNVAFEAETVLPEMRVGIAPNFPNPFSGITRIGYAIARESHVTLDVVDMMGRRVAQLVDGRLPAGSHFVDWNASGVAPGVYGCRLRVDRDEPVPFVRTMLLLR